MTDVFTRKEETQTDTHREDGHVKMEAETGVTMHLQAKEHQGSMATPEAQRKHETGSSQSLQRKQTLPTPSFQISGLQNCKKKNFCCFQPVCGILIWQP